ncbi:hypothetical protein [Kamptonema formosum]|nr:hypothetical protein [Oscillatoria sp. PCC 10802]
MTAAISCRPSSHRHPGQPPQLLPPACCLPIAGPALDTFQA